ncbi:MAG: CRISPR-associated endonuclease Cas1 [Bdellovibrionales bacterium]|nr:CRISPR-associated endonuclease Cas1 [Bdellovibrionales bacterium]
MNKRNYIHIDEVQPLIPLSRRVPFYYTEYSRIKRKNNDIRILKADLKEEYSVPVCGIGGLFLGPGTSITAESMRIISSRGCLIGVMGGNASPLYLCSTQHRSPLPRVRQHKIVFDEKKRINAAKILFKRRALFIKKFSSIIPPPFPSCAENDTINTLLSKEGAWARQAYKSLAVQYEIPYVKRGKPFRGKKDPLTFLNFLSYSLADLTILHLGYDPNIGVLHGRTKGGGLSYDLADIVKPIVALELSFQAIKEEWSLTEIKNQFMKLVLEIDVLNYLLKTLKEVFKKDS